jgi:hypothetical protein
MSRFSPIPKFTELEPIDWGDPGDRRSKANADNYAQRLPAFRPDASAKTAKTVAPVQAKAAAPVAQPKVTPAQAAQAAASAARARHTAVMASKAVAGREKQAEALLLASCKSGAKFGTAEAIIAELGRLPTDAQLAAVDKHCKSVAAQKVWDKAAAKVAGKRGSTSPQSASEQPAKAKETVWDRAWAKIEGARA